MTYHPALQQTDTPPAYAAEGQKHVSADKDVRALAQRDPRGCGNGADGPGTGNSDGEDV